MIVRKLLNTLYVMTEESYLTLDGENIVVQKDKQIRYYSVIKAHL